MKAGQSKGFDTVAAQPTRRSGQIPQKSVYVTIYDVTLGWLVKKIWLGLLKWWVAIKYQWHLRTEGVFGTWRFSWFKVALAAFAVFLVLKKDIQFSINMKTPAERSKNLSSQATALRTSVSELGVGNSLSLGGASSKVATVGDLDDQRVKIYIKRFSKVAQAEMQKYGIPASVKMAQAIVESWAGQQPSTVATNNHFGEPMASRSYSSAWENWRSHSLFLREQYQSLFEAGTSYQKWARALKKASYNNDRKYDQKLIEVIERYHLYELDEQ